MPLTERLNMDLRGALRAHDERRKETLRMVLAAIRNGEIAAGHAMDDTGVLQVIQREIKQRRDSIEEFGKGNRQDLIERESAQIDILQEYLPRQLTRDDVQAAARRVIEETGARGPADKGKVMPALVKQLAGQADGRLINEVVTELLGRS